MEVGLAVPASRGRARKSSDGGWQLKRGAVRTPRLTFARPDIVLPKYKIAIFVHGGGMQLLQSSIVLNDATQGSSGNPGGNRFNPFGIDENAEAS